jgi:hypothetical protein
MMHFLPVSLLAILAGTLLLIKVKKDGLGKFFKFISWFFIVVGFILFIGFLTGGILRMTHCCKMNPKECRQEMMMKRGMPGGMHMGLCCPAGHGMGVCEHKAGCMQNDSTMKCCPKHPEGDTAMMQCPKHK